jgi:hypothetical protein
MDIEAPPARTLDEMHASFDRATADVAAGRVVSACEVHNRLRRAITAAALEQPGTHSQR